MKTNHTPGPWRNGDARNSIFGPNRDNGAAPFKIADMAIQASVDTAERWANARLIAAAPSLLEALHGAVAAFDFTVSAMAKGQTVSISSLQNCAANARAAIAKATA